MPGQQLESSRPVTAAGQDPGGASSPTGPRAGAQAGATARQRRKRITWLMAVFAVLISAGLAWQLSQTETLRLLELKTYDLRFVFRGERKPPEGILLVLVDAETDEAFPEPRIFWHPHYADLLRATAQGGAKAIGLDVFLSVPVGSWEPDFDRQIAAAFSEASVTTPVVVAYDTQQRDTDSLPLYMMAAAEGFRGHSNLTLDADGFVRRQELLSGDDEAQESFAARLAAVLRKESWSRAETESAPADGNPPGALLLGGEAVPLDSAGFMPIHFWGPAGTFPSVSMAEVIRAQEQGDLAALQRWFQDQIVLVGTADQSDQHSTPFFLGGKNRDGGTVGENQNLTPGVEVQANTLATLLERRFLRELPGAWSQAVVLAAAVLAGLCILRVRFPLGPLLLLGAMAGYLWLSVRGLDAGLVLPVVAPLLSVTLSGLASYGVQALREGRQRRLLQEVFGRFVSPEMAQELLDYGEVPLGGTRQPVTVMFTDLRNYTSYCQGRDPQKVVAELNQYFAEMSSEIKAHGGMINKFLGDGIMALFGAPVPHPEDALNAVTCGLQMIHRNEEYNRRRAEAGLEPLVVGVGIHTGEAVVGNIGAPEKMEYTAIGGAVNIASRIEGENKTFKTQLLISEATCRQVADRVAVEPAGSASMKGIEEPMTLYKVIGLKEKEGL